METRMETLLYDKRKTTVHGEGFIATEHLILWFVAPCEKYEFILGPIQ